VDGVRTNSGPGPGRFSSRHMVGWEQSSSPRSGSRPPAILRAGSGAQRVAVVGIRVAGRDQERPKADHLCEPMLHPRGRARILDAAGQALGRAEAALDLRQEQSIAVRGQAPGVERDLDGPADDGRHAGEKRGIIR
jgi:hypothetical protein